MFDQIEGQGVVMPRSTKTTNLKTPLQKQSKHFTMLDNELVNKLGLEEAYILCYIDGWLAANSSNEEYIKDGKVWMFRSIEMMHEKDFPTMSAKTIRRYISRLINIGCLIRGRYNKKNYDKTAWYTIDYDMVCKLISGEVDAYLKKQKEDGSHEEGISDVNSAEDTIHYYDSDYEKWMEQVEEHEREMKQNDV